MTRTTHGASDWVRDSIERDGVVRLGLARGLINVRALAREIHATARGEVSLDALLGAIHRYPLDEGVERRRSTGQAIRKISLRNRVAILSFRNLPDLRPVIARFVGETNRAKEEMLRVSTSPEAVSVTFDEARMNDLEARVPKNDVLRRWTDLAELKVEANLEVEASPGILAVITSELAVNGVNVVQLSTVGPGYIVVLVKSEDATRAYESLARLAKAGERVGP